MYIHSITLENIKSFRDLKLDLKRPDGSYAGWNVIVGGNSSGKSTILKSLALALMGPEFGGRLMASPKGWITNGEQKASIVLEVLWDKKLDYFKKGGSLPSSLFEAGVKWFYTNKNDTTPQFRALDKRTSKGTRILTPERGLWSQNAKGWFSTGYGPMRRLTGSSSEAMRFSVSKEVDGLFTTLFREDAALSESEEWLRRMHSRSLEPDASPDIKKILNIVTELLNDGLLPIGMRISRITVDNVFVLDRNNIELPMRDISDGCRSIYATVLDLIHGLCESYGAHDIFAHTSEGRPYIKMPGVVIIDEVEAHLHPSWQRDIPEWLKVHFPEIQFIVSSHSPLVAQSADKDGLIILPTPGENHTYARKATELEYNKIKFGTAYKTVLGSAFGLHSTRTKWAEIQIKRWQEIDAKKRTGAILSREEKSTYKKLLPQLEMAFEETLEK